MSCKVLIIDNYDSFTYILKQYFGELGGNPEVFFNDRITVAAIKRMKPTHIVLSPGPGTVEEPGDVGVTFRVIEAFHKTTPILGVCLGHQALGKFFGYSIVSAPKIMHGKVSRITHDGKGIFRGLRNPFEAMRYHSLALGPFVIPAKAGIWLDPRVKPEDDMLVTAMSDDRVIMAIQHKTLPLFGVQFHPESLGTPEGKKIVRNFLAC